MCLRLRIRLLLMMCVLLRMCLHLSVEVRSQRLAQPHCGGALALTQWGGGDATNHHCRTKHEPGGKTADQARHKYRQANRAEQRAQDSMQQSGSCALLLLAACLGLVVGYGQWYCVLIGAFTGL
jgi:hypothetical protein